MISLTRKRIRSQAGITIHAMPPSAANTIISGRRVIGGPISYNATKVAAIRAPDHLSLDAEVPEADAEGDGSAHADEDQRSGLKQDGMKILGVRQCFDDKLVEQRLWLHPSGMTKRAAEIPSPVKTAQPRISAWCQGEML